MGEGNVLPKNARVVGVGADQTYFFVKQVGSQRVSRARDSLFVQSGER